MSLLQSEVSSHPVPDWQRQRNTAAPGHLIFHQPFEAPYRSLVHADILWSAAEAWSKQAYEILETNRVRFSNKGDELGEIEKRESDVRHIPHWVWLAAVLPPISSSSFTQWDEAMTAMIREQMPDFYRHPDWKDVPGNHAPRYVQEEILNRIRGGLRKLTSLR